jgi:hypothetical protein
MRFRLVALSLVAGLTGLAVVQWTAAAATTFNVSVVAGGMSSYLIDGANDPTLTLTRGQTYTFNVTSGGHPFWITTAPGAGDAEANAFTLGVTGNGSSPGTVTFVVPASAPATLFYQCSFHDPMSGTLNIVSAAASVPSLGPAMLAALTALLLIVAIAVMRKRRTRG